MATDWAQEGTHVLLLSRPWRTHSQTVVLQYFVVSPSLLKNVRPGAIYGPIASPRKVDFGIEAESPDSAESESHDSVEEETVMMTRLVPPVKETADSDEGY